MMNYENFNLFGMHFFWWIIWVIILFWIFVTPYNIPGQRSKKETPLEILNKRFALGEINEKEYLDKKNQILN